MTFAVPELPGDHIRLIGSASAMRKLSPEQVDELNRQLRGNRTDRRRAKHKLKKLGIQVVYGTDLRDPKTVS